MTAESYGGQIVLGDVAGLVIAAVISASSSGAADFAALPYFLASPVIHGIHGQPARAAGGFFLHLLAPAVGGVAGLLIGLAACDYDKESCALLGFGLGFAAGMIASTAVDAGVLAQNVPRKATPAAVALTPAFSVARTGGVMAGIAGRF